MTEALEHRSRTGNSLMNRSLHLSGLSLLAALWIVAPCPAQPAGPPLTAEQKEVERARTFVWAFEMKLQKLPENDRAAAARTFFAGLKDSVTKSEAIGMMDSRYVYFVPKDVYNEL